MFLPQPHHGMRSCFSNQYMNNIMNMKPTNKTAPSTTSAGSEKSLPEKAPAKRMTAPVM